MIILFGGANNRIAIMMNALQNILIRKVWSVGLWNIMQGTYIVVVETSDLIGKNIDSSEFKVKWM